MSPTRYKIALRTAYTTISLGIVVRVRSRETRSNVSHGRSHCSAGSAPMKPVVPGTWCGSENGVFETRVDVCAQLARKRNDITKKIHLIRVDLPKNKPKSCAKKGRV